MVDLPHHSTKTRRCLQSGLGRDLFASPIKYWKRDGGKIRYDLVHGAVDSLSLGLVELPPPLSHSLFLGFWGGSGRCALRVELLGVGLALERFKGALAAGRSRVGCLSN